MTPLTPRQKEVYDFIAAEIAASGGPPPTYQQIAEGLGLRSLATVFKHVQALTRRGWLTQDRVYRQRSIQLTADSDSVRLDFLLRSCQVAHAGTRLFSRADIDRVRNVLPGTATGDRPAHAVSPEAT